ncbi:hypothetical protein ACN4EK_31985 [Pantanalinema rosaneae CENA516]
MNGKKCIVALPTPKFLNELQVVQGRLSQAELTIVLKSAIEA